MRVAILAVMVMLTGIGALSTVARRHAQQGSASVVAIAQTDGQRTAKDVMTHHGDYSD